MSDNHHDKADCLDIVQKIDAKMGAGWARKFANVLSAGMTLDAKVVFEFEKFNSDGKLKYKSTRTLKKGGAE